MNIISDKYRPLVENLMLPEATVFYYAKFLDKETADKYFQDLQKDIIWRQDTIRLFGREMLIPRLAAWYGEEEKSYTYSGITMHAHPFTKDLLELKTRIEQVVNHTFSSTLLNLYRDGRDSMGLHSDDEKELGKNPVIASISLGEERPFHFKHKRQKSLKRKLILEHGSLLVMAGSTQHHWLHGIPKTARKIGPRINLTFRRIIQ